MTGDNVDVIKWIQYGLMDYDAAVKMIQYHRPIPKEIVCFHCQQSVEKILKAYAIAKNETLIRTHDLVVLLNQCRQYSAEFDKVARPCMSLTVYASLARYPSSVEINEQQMRQALNDMRELISFMVPLFAEMGFDLAVQDDEHD